MNNEQFCLHQINNKIKVSLLYSYLSKNKSNIKRELYKHCTILFCILKSIWHLD